MAIIITQQPRSMGAKVGQSISFNVVATNVTAYQWQFSGDRGNTWRDLNGATTEWASAVTDTLTFEVNAIRLTYLYRCKLTGADGNVLYTIAVMFTQYHGSAQGFVLASTMSDIADAIRAKGETTDAILPADMAGMIEALGKSEILNGSYTVASGSNTTAKLGTVLPSSDNYLFVVRVKQFVGYSTSSSSYYMACAAITCKDGAISQWSMWSNHSSGNNVLYMDKFTVTINGDTISQSGGFMYSSQYDWWYAYE